MEKRDNIKDSKHWKLYYFYFNKDDKRTMVPSRNPKHGPTFNFASPRTYIFVIGVIVVVLLMAIISDFLAGRKN